MFITGGASGIGEALVRRFAAQKASVTFVDINAAAGATLQQTLGNGVRFIECDITDVSGLQAAIQDAVRDNGPVTALVNNAANDDRHDWRDVTSEYWDERLSINLKPAFFTIQAAAPGMIEAGGGSIINFGSVSWMLKMGDMPAYTASKGAAHALTRGFASSLGKHNIRVNTIVPGWVMTQRQIELWVDEAGERTMDENQALPGRVMPDDIASMVLFLAADDSAMCSAQQFIVDGGWV